MVGQVPRGTEEGFFPVLSAAGFGHTLVGCGRCLRPDPDPAEIPDFEGSVPEPTSTALIRKVMP